MSVYGHRCLGPAGRASGCLGIMRPESTEKALYNQLLYFRNLWDVEGTKFEAALLVKTAEVEEGEKEKEKEVSEKVRAVAEWNRERFGTCAEVVEGYLRRCGRVWVQMDELFGFALKL